jgi:hypothetical protein
MGAPPRVTLRADTGTVHQHEIVMAKRVAQRLLADQLLSP